MCLCSSQFCQTAAFQSFKDRKAAVDRTAAFHMGRCRTDIQSDKSITSGMDVLQYVRRSNRFTGQTWAQGYAVTYFLSLSLPCSLSM